jgi:hypothetical protein
MDEVVDFLRFGLRGGITLGADDDQLASVFSGEPATD